MGFLSRFNAIDLRAETRPADWDDLWFERTGYQTLAGTFVNPDVALTLAPFWQGVRIITENLASFPCHVFERTTTNGRSGSKVATNHPVDDLVFRSPFPGETAFQYWETTGVHLILRGNAYSWIHPGPRGFVDRLEIIHPDRVEVFRLPNGERQYRITMDGGQTVRKGAEDIFHILGLSLDMLTGVSVIEYAFQNLGTILGAERFAGRFFKFGAAPAVAVIHKDNLGPTGLANLRDSINAFTAGNENAHGVLALEDDVKVQTLGIKPEEAQLLATREFSLPQIASWLNIPPSLLGDPRTTTYAATRQFRQNLVDLTFRPWVERIEAKIDAELFLNPQRFYSKFNMSALLRGDPKEQADVQHLNIQDGVWSVNEAREKQDMNPIEGGDDPMAPAARPIAPVPANAALSRAQLVALQEAITIVRKEQAAATRAAKAHAGNAEAWQGWLREFYADHAGDVAQRLRLPLPLAREYAARQGTQLAEHGLEAATDWEWTAAPRLANLALCADVHGRAFAYEQEAA